MCPCSACARDLACDCARLCDFGFARAGAYARDFVCAYSCACTCEFACTCDCGCVRDSDRACDYGSSFGRGAVVAVAKAVVALAIA